MQFLFWWGEAEPLEVRWFAWSWWIGVRHRPLSAVLCPWRHIASIHSWYSNLIPLFSCWTAAKAPTILWGCLQEKTTKKRSGDQGFSKGDTESKETRREWGRTPGVDSAMAVAISWTWPGLQMGKGLRMEGSSLAPGLNKVNLRLGRLSSSGTELLLHKSECPSCDLLCATSINHL